MEMSGMASKDGKMGKMSRCGDVYGQRNGNGNGNAKVEVKFS